jgi:TPR repeat protein
MNKGFFCWALSVYGLLTVSPIAHSQAGCPESGETKTLEELAAGGNEFARKALEWQSTEERLYRGSAEALADSKALEVARQGAVQGIAESQATLGWFYYTGKGGVAQDRAEALRWYSKAAEQGDAFAQVSLGVMYANGICTPRNPVIAVAWFRQAANQGDAMGQYYLGVSFYYGRGANPNKSEAARLFLASAEQGLASAQYDIGTMYAVGEGVPTSDTEAYFWLNLAAAQGHPRAKENRDLAARKMSREEIADAQRRSAEWAAKRTK